MTRRDPFSDRIDGAIKTAIAGGQADALESLKTTAAVADLLFTYIVAHRLGDEIVSYAIEENSDCVGLVQQLFKRK